MSYRDILVQVDDSEASARRSEAAARVAARRSAHLTGVFLRTSFPSQALTSGLYGGMPPVVLPQLIKQYDEAVSQAAERARASFQSAASSAAVTCDWMTVSGDTSVAMIDCMRRTDLTVLPRDDLPHLSKNGIGAPRLGLASGGPVLVMPDIAADEPIGRRVLVAWNGSREAARALRDAWSFIRDASQVFVVIVGPGADREPQDLLQRHLERHNSKAELIIDRSAEANADRVLLEQAQRLRVDLVVMGLYGHTRLQEQFLGGVSRQMLRVSPVPLLVSH